MYETASTGSPAVPLITGETADPAQLEEALKAYDRKYLENMLGVDPATGQVGQKLPEEKQTAPTGQKTSQTSDQGQGLADVTAPTDIPQQPAIQAQPPPQLAALTPGNAPAAFDLGQQQSPAGGLPDTDLANAIAQARTANQLRVTA